MMVHSLNSILAEKARRARIWTPFPGPQTLAYFSKADIIFYGGAAGGGKTDFELGLCRNEHYRSVLFRRVMPNLRAIESRSKEIYSPNPNFPGGDFNETLHRWRFPDGRQIEFAHMQHEKNMLDWQGQPHDLYCFDEVTEFTEAQFRFVIGWNRSTHKDPVTGLPQRCRVVAAGNPPTSADGEWVISFWAPWLDENHPNPAQPGELRWFTTIEGKDHEVPDGSPVLVKGEWIQPLSRTFIPARVQDNPTLMASGYISTLQSLPEPLRSKMLYGDFKAGREDNAYQIIPSEWVRLAQERWKNREKPAGPMTSLGVDVARGGDDKTAMAPRYGNWFGEPWTYPGKTTPNGPAVAGLVLTHIDPGTVINVDVIGVGSSVYDYLKDMPELEVIPINGASKSKGTDKSGALHFYNLRAENWWTFRESLDPANGQDIALPPNPEMRADLCAPTWKLTPRGIQVESKEEIIKRIGRSPDIGDAVIYAHAENRSGADALAYIQMLSAEAAAERKKEEEEWEA